jgi:hypothetical protein
VSHGPKLIGNGEAHSNLAQIHGRHAHHSPQPSSTQQACFGVRGRGAPAVGRPGKRKTG